MALCALVTLGCESRLSGPDVPMGHVREIVPCTVTGLTGSVDCVRYSVWEDRSAEAGRSIDLSAVVVRALSGATDPDPVVFFRGGPGASSIEQAAWVTRILGRIRQTRDIVFVDLPAVGATLIVGAPKWRGGSGGPSRLMALV